MSPKFVEATSEHESFRDDLIKAISNHKHLSSEEMLALTAHFLGQLLAAQNQKTMGIERGIRIIQDNIQQGNYEAVQSISDIPTTGVVH